ncbi:L-aspartate oxidase (LASPO) (Quinolinate synthetase B) [Candidatus Glomeribacter gigasporarum BEG34]|uniref:L-aspartate oxidase n=1 Tax=Candidatus Glomeribacter gigasporarum BEG34 TaxID=1070319 RepID=G2J9H6_9BURK|nr:L-aspartate oxidase [Candidatus Glomeribacter gigasporarum]CCD29423.1 L-aspartate oxidase (LASPO) (Quinolinate synthetase B) [Candidatus Glomeribacter gigasporarum BEG34]
MEFDVLIAGSGLAGLSAALSLAESRRVAVLTKRGATDGASDWAQGGIAVSLDASDSAERHMEDTCAAGCALCDAAAVRFVIEHSRSAVEWLMARGAPFTRDAQAASGFHLTREGGHRQRRILHAADATGHAVMTLLAEQAQAHPNITLFDAHFAIDLIHSARLGLSGQRCYGLYALDMRTGSVRTFRARHTILATGGAGKAYLYTTNPDTATGDGMAMAWRAGCRIANMEFIQFHPTCLYHPYAKSFLISEAVRGEGGVLKLPDGARFMPAYDARAELAPRDIVARAIDFEIKKRGMDCVYLDIHHRPAEFLRAHFPTILARCLEFGIDITREPIPVVPAAHYACGGVVTDVYGRADLAGLYAIGETACTGLHGANRLASNSLLECVVMGRAAAQAILAASEKERHEIPALPAWDESRVTDSDEEVVITHNWDELRRLMWNYVGIVRTDKRLARAAHRIVRLREEIDEYYAHFRISRDLLELRNLVDVASLIVESARFRHESRGLHFNRDWPEMQPKGLPTILSRAFSSRVTTGASAKRHRENH